MSKTIKTNKDYVVYINGQLRFITDILETCSISELDRDTINKQVKNIKENLSIIASRV